MSLRKAQGGLFESVRLPEPPPDLGARIVRTVAASSRHGSTDAVAIASGFRLASLDRWLAAWALLLAMVLALQSIATREPAGAPRPESLTTLTALADELQMAPETLARQLPGRLDTGFTHGDVERREAALREAMEVLR